jgi:hypothetical protein
VNVDAVARFHAAQSRLLADTYDRAWRHGVASYEPAAEGADGDGSAPAAIPAAGGLLAARAAAYVAPSTPDERAKADALRGAANGLEGMAGELLALHPSAAHDQQAADAVSSEAILPHESSAYAEALAAREWAESNQWRLNAGDSVAWSGEQRGYAEAANVDGQLLEWLPESDGRVCESCESLGSLPPMPLGDWPTTPGAGDTICREGCRCVLQVADEHELGPNGEPPALSRDQEDVVSRIAERREPPAPASYRESQRGPEIPAALRRGLAAYAAEKAV